MDDNPYVIPQPALADRAKQRVHGRMLAAITVLFAGRVLGQALVAYSGVTWLPAMEHWYSGLIPYTPLLIVQLLMLILMIRISGEIWRGVGFFAEVRRHWSDFLEKFAAVYAGLMVLRYLLTMIEHPEMRWFGHTIPIFFHFVLAGFIYVLGHYHQAEASE